MDTKEKIKQALLQFAKKNQLNKVTVKQLCQACMINRQTFYYHFQDKYDLLAYVFEQDFASAYAQANYLNSEMMINNMLGRMKQKHFFYRQALMDTNLNGLGGYILKKYITMEQQALQLYLHLDQLPYGLDYKLKNYSYGCLLHTQYWLNHLDEIETARLAHCMFMEMPLSLREAFYQTNPLFDSSK